MIDQTDSNSREKWLAEQVRKRSNYKPTGRNYIRPHATNNLSVESQPQVSKSREDSSASFKSQIHSRAKPNSFMFDRQRKSKVIYRNLESHH